MREIKFRAWNEEDRTMSQLSTGVFRCLADETDFAGLLETQGIFIMQYIGLKDKNGKEIYEGDILKGRNIGDYKGDILKGRNIVDKEYKISEVKWNNEPFQQSRYGWEPFNFYSTNGCNGYDDDYYDVEDCEVIGNIWENPELLEEGK